MSRNPRESDARRVDRNFEILLGARQQHFINGVSTNWSSRSPPRENPENGPRPLFSHAEVAECFGAGCTAVGVVLVLLCGCGSRSGIGHFRAPLSQFRAESLHTDMSDTLRFDVSTAAKTARPSKRVSHRGGEPLVVVRANRRADVPRWNMTLSRLCPEIRCVAVRFDTSGQRGWLFKVLRVYFSGAASVRCGSTSRPTCSDVGKSEIIVIFAGVVNWIVAGKRSRTVCGWRRLPGRSGRTKAEGRFR